MDSLDEYLAAAGIAPSSQGPMGEAAQAGRRHACQTSQGPRPHAHAHAHAEARNRRLAYAMLCLQGRIADGYLSPSKIAERFPGLLSSRGPPSPGAGPGEGAMDQSATAPGDEVALHTTADSTGAEGSLALSVRQASMTVVQRAAASTPSFSDVLGKAAMRLVNRGSARAAATGASAPADGAESLDTEEESEEAYSGPEATQALLAATTADDPVLAREEAIHLLVQRFVAGEDGLYIDYSEIDNNESLDSIPLSQGAGAGGTSQRDRDREEQYFSETPLADTDTDAGVADGSEQR